jgi:ligand-binding SRPBCC domain-containing protein
MPRIELTIHIEATIERCFDLSRSVEAHLHSTAQSGERVVGGVTAGLLSLGDEVTWEARHLGIRQRLTSRITQFDRPHHFRDSMVRGAFARFDHDHFFEATATGTLARDVFDFAAPLGALGWAAERLFLTGYMRRFLEERNHDLKRLAESDAWRAFLPGS